MLVVRETPLHLGHLRLMCQTTEMGAVILPPVPGLYAQPQTIQDLIDHTITKICDQLAVPTALIDRWDGL